VKLVIAAVTLLLFIIGLPEELVALILMGFISTQIAKDEG
jgi:hypothetical protein